MTMNGVPNVAVTGRILVVDDHEPNRLLLREILEQQGHTVTEAEGGYEALDAVASQEFDLLLLDVNMPGVNGVEVCRRLRADPHTASLPIILVTSLTHREHRLEGIAAGASDYLSKPIDRHELLLRVRNSLQMHKLHLELAAQYRDLRRLETLRDSLVHMLVHDLRSPLTAIMGFLELMRTEIDPATQTVLLSDLNEVMESVGVLSDMVTTVLDVSRFESQAMPLTRTTLDLGEVAGSAISSLGGRSRPVIRFDRPAAPVRAVGDLDVIRRVMMNLMANAVKFSPRGAPVLVHLMPSDDEIRFEVVDSGPGIAPEHHEKIFEKFGQVESAEGRAVRSSGLGLTFCKMAIEAHGGRIGLHSTVGAGSTFWFVLPAEHQPAAVA
jgi:signal transduction histidine kinase